MTDAEIQQMADEAGKLLAMATNDYETFKTYTGRAIMCHAKLMELSYELKGRMKHE